MKRRSAATKYKKAPQAPRRFKSAYIFFSTQKHKEIRKEFKEKGENANINTTEVAKMVSKAWKSMSPSEREPFEEMARRDRERYDYEKSVYDGPWKVPADDAVGAAAAVDATPLPERPLAAFLVFCNDHRPRVKDQYPHLTHANMTRKLTELWKTVDPTIKQGYLDAEADARRRYQQAMEEWQARHDLHVQEEHAARQERAREIAHRNRVRQQQQQQEEQEPINGEHRTYADESGGGRYADPLRHSSSSSSSYPPPPHSSTPYYPPPPYYPPMGYPPPPPPPGSSGPNDSMDPSAYPPPPPYPNSNMDYYGYDAYENHPYNNGHHYATASWDSSSSYYYPSGSYPAYPPPNSYNEYGYAPPPPPVYSDAHPTTFPNNNHHSYDLSDNNDNNNLPHDTDYRPTKRQKSHQEAASADETEKTAAAETTTKVAPTRFTFDDPDEQGSGGISSSNSNHNNLLIYSPMAALEGTQSFDPS